MTLRKPQRGLDLVRPFGDCASVDGFRGGRHTDKTRGTPKTGASAKGGHGMSGLLALSRGIDRFNELVGKWVSWLILVAILVSAGNAVIRKAFNASSNAWLELQWYLFGAAWLLAAAYTLKQNEHIRIDIVYGLWPRRVQHWIDILGHIFFLMPFVLLMIYYFVPYFMVSFNNGEHSPNSGGLLIWPAKLALLVGFLLLGLQGISEIIKKIAIMNGLLEDPNPFVTSHEAAALESAALVEELKK
jgi:TRAP-type mannitol/chloroaromatic compound transport system permease small subunit